MCHQIIDYLFSLNDVDTIMMKTSYFMYIALLVWLYIHRQKTMLIDTYGMCTC